MARPYLVMDTAIATRDKCLVLKAGERGEALAKMRGLGTGLDDIPARGPAGWFLESETWNAIMASLAPPRDAVTSKSKKNCCKVIHHDGDDMGRIQCKISHRLVRRSLGAGKLHVQGSRKLWEQRCGNYNPEFRYGPSCYLGRSIERS